MALFWLINGGGTLTTYVTSWDPILQVLVQASLLPDTNLQTLHSFSEFARIVDDCSLKPSPNLSKKRSWVLPAPKILEVCTRWVPMIVVNGVMGPYKWSKING